MIWEGWRGEKGNPTPSLDLWRARGSGELDDSADSRRREGRWDDSHHSLMMIVMMSSESDPSKRGKDVKLAKPVYFVTVIAATFIPTKRNLMRGGIWKTLSVGGWQDG